MLKIIFINENYVIVEKPVGVSSQLSESGNDMLTLLSDELNIPKENIHPVHRLDNAVGGTMVYAISKKSAAAFSALISSNQMKKYYLAVIHGEPDEKNGIFKDLLFKDSKINKSFVVKRMRKGVKEAELQYEVLDTVCFDGEKISLVKILLHTGRTHQIRVQFSHRKLPLLGDRRYGSGKDKCTVALWSNELCFISPFTKKEEKFQSQPDVAAFPWSLFFVDDKNKI